MCKRCFVFTIIICVAVVAGCASEHKSALQTQQQKTKAQGAYNSGLAAILRETKVEIDVIWVLREILKISPNEKLELFVNEKTASIAKHSSLRLIDPNASYNNLSENPGSGITRYSSYLKAPFGKPEERAISFLSDFTGTEESGYILTHQFFVLLWADEMGLKFPQSLRDRKKVVLERILKEQQQAKSFSDLYAERAAILLHWTNPERKDADAWINKIIGTQAKDGNWPTYPFILFYDGQSAVITPPVSHTTVLSLFAIQAYLQGY